VNQWVYGRRLKQHLFEYMIHASEWEGANKKHVLEILSTSTADAYHLGRVLIQSLTVLLVSLVHRVATG